MTKESNVNAKSEPGRTGNTVGTVTGFQDLQTGLVHNADGSVITPEVKDPDTIVESQSIGAYDRHVHVDGSVQIIQVRPLDGGAEIETPVPRPGGEQDQANAGLGDNSDAKVIKASSSSK